MLNVVVFGAGSIGLYCGGLLAAGGASVSFIGRPRFGDLVTAHGLTLSHYARESVTIAPDKFGYFHDAARASAALGAADIVLVCVKSQDSAQAAKDMLPYLGVGTRLISFQNGLGNAKVMADILTGHHVLGAVVPFNVTQKTDAPAAWHCGTEGALTIETVSGPHQNQLRDTYDRAGQAVNFVDNITAVQWGKLLVNLNNGLNALSGGTLREGLLQRAYRAALAAMISEALNVLARAGITPAAFGKASPQKMIKILRLPNWLYKIIMQRIVKIDAAARSSMLDDLEAGRGCEIAYLQGEIVALADSLGMSAPINAKVKAMVEAAFDDGKSPNMSGQEIYAAIMPD